MSGRPWLVLRIKSQQYNMAAENVRNQRADFYCPRALVRSVRTRTLRPEPMFPGYAFAAPHGPEWVFLKSTRGVQDVLMGTGEAPAWVLDAEIASIRSREDADGVVHLDGAFFKPGDKVAIEDGPFESLLGVYDGMSSQERVFVLLNVLGRQVRAQIAARSVSRA